MDVLFRIFMKNGLVEVKIPLCAAGGFPSLQTRVTLVNTLRGGGCGFLKCGAWCGVSGGARCMVWWIWRSKICGVVHDVVDQEEHDVPFSRS